MNCPSFNNQRAKADQGIPYEHRPCLSSISPGKRAFYLVHLMVKVPTSIFLEIDPIPMLLIQICVASHILV